MNIGRALRLQSFMRSQEWLDIKEMLKESVDELALSALRSETDSEASQMIISARGANALAARFQQKVSDEVEALVQKQSENQNGRSS